MPTVIVKKNTSKDPNAAFDEITDWLESDPELKKLDSAYQCQFDKSTLSGTATGKQFKANLKINNSGPDAEVTIKVELPFHLGLVKGMVKSTIEKKLSKILG